ncbi:MAG TPA: tetratricopeptide repeat protein [Gemmatimonadota bacterium]|nr:tetratricopeptide repeat protein [Gemmatimonadota bacterium]
MTAHDPLSGLEERYRQLKDALTQAQGDTENVKLIGSIARLSADLAALERRIGELRSGLRQLVDENPWLSKDAAPETSLDPSAPPLRSDRLNSSTYAQQGWDCIAVGDYEGAREKLKRALKLAPDDVEALSMLGWAQTMSHDYDDALMTYHRVLAANPKDLLARVNLGFICMKKEIYGEAVEHLSTVIRDGADRKAVLYANYYLGLVYLARQMYEDAEGYFQQTVELGPAMCEAYFQLGQTRYMRGRRADAISTWRRGVAANCYNPWSERCRDAARAVEAGEPPELD